MRPLELLALLAILPVLVWPLLPWPRPRWLAFLPGMAVLLLLASLLWEGYRWQMLPAYLLAGLLFLITLPRLREPAPGEKRYSAWMVAGSLLGLAAWLAALALPILLPVPSLPATTGPYAAGTQIFHLIDEGREEIYGDAAGGPREIMMQLWYPAAAGAQGEPARYLDALAVMGPVVAERLGLPAFLLDHVDLVDLDARMDVPLLEDGAPFPLLVFAHGLRGLRAQNTAMVRELVSQGFVVATIDHTYGNALTVFPDNRVALHDPDLLSGEGTPPRTSNQLVRVWADDIGFVLDELAVWNEEAGGALNGRLDLQRVGVFGHSTGGGATVEFCGRDARCRAAVGLDAWLAPVSPEIMAGGLAQPVLLLQAKQWEFGDGGVNDARVAELLAAARDTAYVARIDGAAHYDFTDVPLLSPLTRQLGLSGAMDGRYVVEMMNSMTVAHFAHELLGQAQRTVLGAAEYAEMSVVGNGR